MEGKFVIVRSYEAGVFAGELVSVTDTAEGRQRVTLNRSRRLWQWVAKDGVALSGLATFGINRAKSKIDSEVDGHVISGVIEIIPCTLTAKESIDVAD